MSKFIINGGKKLSGTVEVQYSKNVAMKLVLIPLMADGIYTLNNIPNITSITNLLAVNEAFGCKVEWIDDNRVKIDSRNLTPDIILSDELFSHTSGGLGATQIIAARFGKCRFEKKDISNIGGDNIGSRSLNLSLDNAKKTGISRTLDGDVVTMVHESLDGLDFAIDDSSYGISVGALYPALFKKSPSVLREVTKHPDYRVIVGELVKLGVKAEFDGNDLIIHPIEKLNPSVEITNIRDLHDFVTMLSLGLSTSSEITISGYDKKTMDGEIIEEYLNRIGAKYTIAGTDFILAKNNFKELNPIDIIASSPPYFLTEWQVVLAPLFAQIKGISNIAELWFTDRLGHWDQLAKMGAKFEYLANRQNRENKPFVVRVNGGINFTCAEVLANDLRAGACLTIAGLCATGTTEVSGVEHVHRGYERFVERLQGLGADIKEVE